MRIVSLLPSASEILGALGLAAQVVAVSHECDYPAEVAAKPRITSSILEHDLSPAQIDSAVNEAVQAGRALYRIDGDLLARLRPDLIVTQGVCDVCAVGVGTIEETLKFLPDCLPPGARTLSLSGKTVAGIFRDIRQVAQAAGAEARGEVLVGELEQRWQRVAVRSEKAQSNKALPKKTQSQKTQSKKTRAERPRVLVLEWSDPPFYAGHWVPEQLEVAGGVDVLGAVGAVSARVSWADILKTDPDLVIMAACGYGAAANTAFARDLYEHPEARRLRAVRAGRVYAADANAYFSRPGPRVVRGAELLQQLFAGVAVPDSELVQVLPGVPI